MTGLWDAIATHRLPPGSRLNQRDLAEQLTVSRQPVSHALHRLKATGLAIETGRRGWSWRPSTSTGSGTSTSCAPRSRAWSRPAPPHAFAMATPGEDIARLRELLAFGPAIGEETAVQDCIVADVDFHLCLFRLAASAVIMETVEPLWPHFRRSMGSALSIHNHRRCPGPAMPPSPPPCWLAMPMPPALPRAPTSRPPDARR